MFYGFFCDGLLIECLSIVKYPSRSEAKKTLYKLIAAFHDMVYARDLSELFGKNVDSISIRYISHCSIQSRSVIQSRLLRIGSGSFVRALEEV